MRITSFCLQASDLHALRMVRLLKNFGIIFFFFSFLCLFSLFLHAVKSICDFSIFVEGRSVFVVMLWTLWYILFVNLIRG